MSGFRINTPTSICFGKGTAGSVRSALEADSRCVALVRGVSGTASAPVARDLKDHGLDVLEIRVDGEPSVSSVNAALKDCEGADIRGIVACGGGSVIDTGKALTFCLSNRTGLPDDLAQVEKNLLARVPGIRLIAIPTTAGTGAEVTSTAVLATRSSKTSLRGRGLFPPTALVDPDLMPSAPENVVLGSGLDAVVQTIESYTSRFATPFSDALTAPNVSPGLKALRRVVEEGAPEAWNRLAWVSLSSGLALANSGLGAAHGLGAVLGGRLNAPHGALCGRLIGPVLLRNRAVAGPGTDASGKIDRCIRAIDDVFPPRDAGRALSGFDRWLRDRNLPRLRDFSPDPASFDEIAKAAAIASSSTKNAVALTHSDFRAILEAAY